jgi:multiple sugar transport system ATP-binding protein
MTMGHRISVMNQGKIQQVGTPLELYDRPANVFVAQFIGTPPMNLFKGTITDGGSRITAAKFSLPVPQTMRKLTENKVEKKIVFGIRPENILETGREVQGETAPIRAEVEIAEPLGHEVVVHAKIGDDFVVAKLEPHVIPKMGDPIDLTVELERIHLFDEETEKRITE